MEESFAAMFEGFLEQPTETKAVVVGFREPTKPKKEGPKPKFVPKPLAVKLMDLHANKEVLRRPCERVITGHVKFKDGRELFIFNDGSSRMKGA